MLNIIRHIIRGCGYIEGYGNHPGTETMIVFIFITGLAGASRGGWLGFGVGCGLAAMLWVPMYLYGAYGRSKDAGTG